MRGRVARLAFNRGLVSNLGLARSDIRRLAMAAETSVNWMPRVLGSMAIRVGLGYIGQTYNDSQAFFLPFEFSVTDVAAIECTDTLIRPWVSEAPITRPAVSTAVANGNFAADIASWTDASDAGGTLAWVAGGYLGLTGNGTAFAIARQQLAVAVADRNVEHALRIIVRRGPVILRVGSASGADDLIAEVELGRGEHSLAFTPLAASAWVDLKTRTKRQLLVDSCTIEAAGEVTIAAPWTAADLRKIRFDQSGDVLFVACDGFKQRKIERHATRSWSLVHYEPTDGPFRTENVTTTTLSASAISGNVTVTSSKPLFRSTHVDALFMMISVGQTVTSSLTAENTFTNTIRVTGISTARGFTVDLSGIAGSTLTLQRSFDDGASWIDVKSWTADTSETFDDGLDNQIILYRVGIKTGDYGADTVAATLAITTGSITGVVRVTEFTDSQNVEAEVITDLGGTDATDQWAEGKWSEFRGYPTAVAFDGGRLGWSGRDAIDLSISDAFDGFDPNFEGDAGPISRTIGSGPVDVINWIVGLQRLLLGGEGAEFSVRASSLDEPLTPTNFNLKRCSRQGSAPVQAINMDPSAVFVQRGGVRVYELAWGQSAIDYEATHLSALVPKIGSPGIVRLALQTQPDPRLHCVRSDGTVAILVWDKVEDVVCWLEVETAGQVEDVFILPGDAGAGEDKVYYVVRRDINGSIIRCVERWALESECEGAALCKLADSFVTYSGAAATVISVPHLVGEQVVVWADGRDVGTASDGSLTYTVSAGGTITLATAASNVVVGLPYSASWKSAKLVELMANVQGMLNDMAILKQLGLLLANTHAQGIKFGHTLTESEMDALPKVHEGAIVDPDTVHAELATDPITMPGGWSNDARLCLLAKAPRPCTILAALAELEHHGA